MKIAIRFVKTNTTGSGNGKQGVGWRLERWGNRFDNMLREVIPEEVTFEKTPKWSEGVSQEKSWGGGIVEEGTASEKP